MAERMMEVEEKAGMIDGAVRDLQLIVSHHPDVATQEIREAICIRLRSIANLAGSLRRGEARGEVSLDPAASLRMQIANSLNCLSVMMKRNVLRVALPDLADDDELLKIRNMAEIVVQRIDQYRQRSEVEDVRQSA